MSKEENGTVFYKNLNFYFLKYLLKFLKHTNKAKNMGCPELLISCQDIKREI